MQVQSINNTRLCAFKTDVTMRDYATFVASVRPSSCGRLKGNRVKISDSPAAVNPLSKAFAHYVTDIQFVGKTRKCRMSQKTCRQLVELKNIGGLVG